MLRNKGFVHSTWAAEKFSTGWKIWPDYSFTWNRSIFPFSSHGTDEPGGWILTFVIVKGFTIYPCAKRHCSKSKMESSSNLVTRAFVSYGCAWLRVKKMCLSAELQGIKILDDYGVHTALVKARRLNSCVNGTPKRTNFQPVKNSSGSVRTHPKTG